MVTTLPHPNPSPTLLLPPEAPATIPPAARDALSRFVLALGLPPESAAAIANGDPFMGPSGLACRVHVSTQPPAFRPEVLLPVTIDELDAAELRRLLTIQATVLSEFGWYLGPGADGLVILAVPQWIEAPEDAAQALDVANGLAQTAFVGLIAPAAASGAAGH